GPPGEQGPQGEPGILPGVIVATQCEGDDLGAQINAADALLGSSPGTIYVPHGNYTISTPIVLSPNRELVLGMGLYHVVPESFPSGAGALAVITLKSNTKNPGSGWGTIIEEPPSLVVIISLQVPGVPCVYEN